MWRVEGYTSQSWGRNVRVSVHLVTVGSPDITEAIQRVASPDCVEQLDKAHRDGIPVELLAGGHLEMKGRRIL